MTLFQNKILCNKQKNENIIKRSLMLNFNFPLLLLLLMSVLLVLKRDTVVECKML